MGPEFLLYGYGLVCLSMLAFNLIYSLHLRSDERRLQRRAAALADQVEQQVRELRDAGLGPQGQARQARDLTWMRRRLARVNYLLAFDRFLDTREDDPALAAYLQELQPVLLDLAVVYRKREDTQAAYYCHFLSRHWSRFHLAPGQIQKVILSYLEKNSLYCRINALKALCVFGEPETLVRALLELGRAESTPLHEKVITEALLTYPGDSRALIDRLWDRFDRFPLAIQRAVLDYIRFASGEDPQPMEGILRDTHRNQELRFAAIRYFGKYPNAGVEDILLDFLRDPDPLHWEYAAISASALAGYPGQAVVEALLQACGNPNWYVRYNASASLEAHGLPLEQLLPVLKGSDRYAREILSYRLKTKQMWTPAEDSGEKVTAKV